LDLRIGVWLMTTANRWGAATISYSLYPDAARTLVWGEADGMNTVAGTGNGAVQTLDVYGQIPTQTTLLASTRTP
jgi:spore coat protein U-like protein